MLPFVSALAVSGSNLYAGSSFTSAGNSPAYRIAKWDGSSWSAVGSGIGLRDPTISPFVRVLVESGSDLYAGGLFTTAGGSLGNSVAKWNGSSWTPLGSGMNSTVSALAVSGGDLYAGGYFSAAGGSEANYIAKWDGSSWGALGSEMNGIVFTLAVLGSDLYAGGLFTTAGGSPATNIAKWNGTSWTALSPMLNGSVAALAVSGSDLYVGGYFTTAEGSPANSIAKWNNNRAWTPCPRPLTQIAKHADTAVRSPPCTHSNQTRG